MTSALIRLVKGRSGVPVPVIAPIASGGQIEESFRRVIQETPVEHLFNVHGRVNPGFDLSKLVPSWTKTEAAQCRLLLNWAQPRQMIRSGEGGVTIEPLSPISRPSGRAKPEPGLATRLATTSGHILLPGSGLVQFSDQTCQELLPSCISDASVTWFAHNDALQRVQTANDKLIAAKSDYQQLDLQRPNLRQLNSDLNDMSAALAAWQQDHDQAVPAMAHATDSAAGCTSSSASDEDGLTVPDWAAEAQSFGKYFTDANALLEIATLNQQFQALWQSLVMAAQQAQAQIDLQQGIQGLSIQIRNGITAKNQWWGLQLILDESSTQALEALLQKEIDDAFKSAVVAIATLPVYGPLAAVLWVLVIIESALVQGDIIATDQGKGVTLNVSWIPLGATVLLDITSGGAATPEIINFIKLAEEATLLAEFADPGVGNQWYSFFWITRN